MENTERFSVQFYQKLGKLFYAIAAADNVVRKEEHKKLKAIVKSEWMAVDDFEDDFHTDAAYQIEVVFDWLTNEEKLHALTWFDDFIDFKEEHPQLFNEQIKKLILKTGNAIAASFSGKNKAELIMLAKLTINFKQT